MPVTSTSAVARALALTVLATAATVVACVPALFWVMLTFSEWCEEGSKHPSTDPGPNQVEFVAFFGAPGFVGLAVVAVAAVLLVRREARRRHVAAPWSVVGATLASSVAALGVGRSRADGRQELRGRPVDRPRCGRGCRSAAADRPACAGRRTIGSPSLPLTLGARARPVGPACTGR